MIDETIDRLVQDGEAVTLAALGGMSAVTEDDEASPMFAYVAEAVAAEWDQIGAEDRTLAANRIVGALTGLRSGLALAEVARAVVPAAGSLGIVHQVKDALRARVSDRKDEKAAAMAATALRWLTHLAITAPEARHALFDVLTGVAPGEASESVSFAVAASQMASVAYDHWRETSAKECLQRLTRSDAESDAWFGLGQARLADALEAEDREAMVAELREALSCFVRAGNTGQERPDAAIYVHVLRFVTAWSARAPAEMLQAHLDAAERSLQEYVRVGFRLPEQPGWLRPRFGVEVEWIDLVNRMRTALQAEALDSWLHAAPVINALADTYRAANAMRPLRAPIDQPAGALATLLVPRLVAPLVEHKAHLALVDRWVEESDAPEADLFRELIRMQEVVPPKARPSGLIRR